MTYTGGKQILVLESVLSGHHPVYLERIADAFLRAGNSVIIALGASSEVHDSIQRLKAKWPSLEVCRIGESKIGSIARSSFGVVGRELIMRMMFANVYRQISATRHVDHVFFPYLDYCLHAMAVLGSPFGDTPWSGICMRPSFHLAGAAIIAPKPSFARLKERLFFRLLRQRTLKRLFTIDEFLREHVMARSAEGETLPLTYLPDPAELCGENTRDTARAMFGIPDDKFVVLAYGSLDERKGVRTLLAAVASPNMDADVAILAVGRQSESVRSLLESESAIDLIRNGQLWSINRFVDGNEEQAAFAAADVIWLGYEGHYAMSGVLVLAAQAGKPVVATREGLIGRYVRDAGLGVDIPVTPEATRDAVCRMRCDKSSLPRAAVEKFRAHTWQEFLPELVETVA